MRLHDGHSSSRHRCQWGSRAAVEKLSNGSVAIFSICPYFVQSFSNPNIIINVLYFRLILTLAIHISAW